MTKREENCLRAKLIIGKERVIKTRRGGKLIISRQMKTKAGARVGSISSLSGVATPIRLGLNTAELLQVLTDYFKPEPYGCVSGEPASKVGLDPGFQLPKLHRECRGLGNLLQGLHRGDYQHMHLELSMEQLHRKQCAILIEWLCYV